MSEADNASAPIINWDALSARFAWLRPAARKLYGVGKFLFFMVPYIVITLMFMGVLSFPDGSRHPTPEPTPSPSVRVDPAVRSLGRSYRSAITNAGQAYLDFIAAGSFAGASDLTAKARDEFDRLQEAAWGPIAAELTTRFGPMTDAPWTGDGAAVARDFFANLAAGYRGP